MRALPSMQGMMCGGLLCVQTHCWVDRLLSLHHTSLARCTHVGLLWVEGLYACAGALPDRRHPDDHR